MSDSLLYRVPEVEGHWPDYFPSGTFREEARLVARLRAFSDRHGLPKGLFIHVYEADPPEPGIGRRHVGSVHAGSVLMAGEIDLDRAKA